MAAGQALKLLPVNITEETELHETEKELELQLCQKAQHDALTGLPNRLLLDDRLQQAIERAKRNRMAAAVLMLDLDNFKQINEAHKPALPKPEPSQVEPARCGSTRIELPGKVRITVEGNVYVLLPAAGSWTAASPRPQASADWPRLRTARHHTQRFH